MDAGWGGNAVEIGTALTAEAEEALAESMLDEQTDGNPDSAYVRGLQERIKTGELGVFTLLVGGKVAGIVCYRCVDAEAELIYGSVRTAYAGIEGLFLGRILRALAGQGAKVTRSGFAWPRPAGFIAAAGALGFRHVRRLSMAMPVDENLMFSYVPVPGINVVPWNPAYVEEVCQIMYEASTPEDREVYPLFSSPEGARALLLSIIRNRHGLFTPELSMVAQVGGQTAGFLITSLLADGSVLILDIAVKKEFQHWGIGTKMIENLASKCAVTGRKTIVLAVTEQNESAIGLYRKTGFSETGRFDQYVVLIDKKFQGTE